MNELRVEYVAPESLVAWAKNPRKIGREALGRLAALLDRHGFVTPVVARREDRTVIGGHQRIQANRLRERPDERVPVIFLSGLSDAQAAALNVALNNPAAQGEFDQPRLAELLGELSTAGLDVPAATGFDEQAIAELTASLAEPPALEEPEAPGKDHGAPGEGVLVILEMDPAAYRAVKAKLDALIAEHGLTCHVRMD